MKNIILNNDITLAIPDSFRETSEAELGQNFIYGGGEGKCFSDPDRHMLITAGWKKIGAFSSFFLNENDLVDNMEKKLRKPMEPFGYRLLGITSAPIGKKTAGGIRYTYTAQGVDMYAESYVIKVGKNLWYFHLYTRVSTQDENLPLWNQILATARWA